METLQILLQFSINMMLDHLLPSIYLQSFLEWTRTSFEQCLAEFHTLLLEEHLQVSLWESVPHSSLQN
jgi:hypothetical protein